jgi:hypothetical protein
VALVSIAVAFDRAMCNNTCCLAVCQCHVFMHADLTQTLFVVITQQEGRCCSNCCCSERAARHCNSRSASSAAAVGSCNGRVSNFNDSIHSVVYDAFHAG